MVQGEVMVVVEGEEITKAETEGVMELPGGGAPTMIEEGAMDRASARSLCSNQDQSHVKNRHPRETKVRTIHYYLCPNYLKYTHTLI